MAEEGTPADHGNAVLQLVRDVCPRCFPIMDGAEELDRPLAGAVRDAYKSRLEAAAEAAAVKELEQAIYR